MGPRVFTRGNIKITVVFLMYLLLQWGHASSRVETLAQVQAANKQEASMGPRVFTRGNQQFFTQKSRLTLRFNGATRLHAWKRRSKNNRGTAADALQWGHASSRVETFLAPHS